VIALAMYMNRFFSMTVRIQTERGHTVVDTGPYGTVRHPGYVGMLLFYAAVPFVLGSRWALVPAVFTVMLLIVRTALEDRTLRAELPGYTDYAARVHYRLLPGVW
jgi:protein-S-isoprenylcysteine O-methyltransferase Ste14